MNNNTQKNSNKYLIPPNNISIIRKPNCEYFSICGGCSLQHIPQNTQIYIKNKILEKNFNRFKIRLSKPFSPVSTNEWHYRHKARMSVKYDIKKDRVLIGFREKNNSRFVANINSCEILPKHISTLIPELKKIVRSLSILRQIPQIELICSEEVSIMVFRTLIEASKNDVDILNDFSEQHNISIYLQPGNELSMFPINTTSSKKISYKIEKFNVELQFKPYHFTQVNPDTNKQMIAKAINLLKCNSNDNILDLFCGIGNFSIPIATIAKSVIGIELSNQMVEQAKQNAQNNNLTNTTFLAIDLQKQLNFDKFNNVINKVIIDPPRNGAASVLPEILSIKPEYILYISCNPDTLSSDAKIILQHNYSIETHGIVDMFSQTKHIESMVLFRYHENVN
ncbi:MAG: 23S rRNA (uracil(1939)-C(5))-methyltransferase RlmD [Legionellales bacterium]|nr:23S rRNA (uracil(1939)-C(5))-methyltransferase RlmD [Legionellales bacterium]